MTLTEFLLARIAEDEADAQPTYCGGWYPPEERAQFKHYRPHYPDEGWSYCDGCCAAEAFDSGNARTLAECEAKRRIIDYCDAPDPHSVSEAATRCVECMVLYLLALPYANHPDYDDAWRP